MLWVSSDVSSGPQPVHHPRALTTPLAPFPPISNDDVATALRVGYTMYSGSKRIVRIEPASESAFGRYTVTIRSRTKSIDLT